MKMRLMMTMTFLAGPPTFNKVYYLLFLFVCLDMSSSTSTTSTNHTPLRRLDVNQRRERRELFRKARSLVAQRRHEQRKNHKLATYGLITCTPTGNKSRVKGKKIIERPHELNSRVKTIKVVLK